MQIPTSGHMNHHRPAYDQTEKEVVDEISHLKGSITLIVIAHRLTTLKHCDIIYEIDNGRLIRQGDYETIVGSTR